MNTKVRSYLIDLARKTEGYTTTYQRLSDDCELGLQMQEKPSDSNILASILEEISVFEYEGQRPLLSALVVRAADNQEGDGFYRIAEKLGFGDRDALKEEGKFAKEQIHKCLEFWRDDKNFNSKR